MPLSDFCDLVWAEIWDDCAPMGDHGVYHMIVTRLIWKGEPAHTITWRDSNGKTHRLAEHTPDITSPVQGDKLAEARRLMEQVKQAREAARVASAPDGVRN